MLSNIIFGKFEDKMAFTQDILWTEYNEFDNKIGSFDAD